MYFRVTKRSMTLDDLQINGKWLPIL